ncbi:protein-L-isoaspartate O-methyltransferase family protein [Streptodolium elevatio]|uniref:Protein-L-isoaspartate O-methyltransferase n=1 Tax=Streptodolium elevatio TaxID=3157996 RepID=A0ABV3DCR6_9ACTN
MTLERSQFVPDRVWPFDPGSQTYGSVVDRAADPRRWTELVGADVQLVTQWDDGGHDGGAEPGRVPSSSASMPTVVRAMLRALDPRPGGHYLEVGTGTGETAARLARAVGPEGSVTSLEIDAKLAAGARANLERAGVRNVKVIHTDAWHGRPEGAPYDGVHVTCGVRRIPSAWVTQCVPGARIVAPWGTDFTPHDWLLTLEVAADGSASGRFGMGLSFMKMRAQRRAHPDHDAYAPPGWLDRARRRETELTGAEARSTAIGDAALAIGLQVPDCTQHYAATDDAVTVWLYSLTDNSMAAAGFADGMVSQAAQSGPRSLWDELEAAWHRWLAHGRPASHQFGLTVDAQGQRPWLAPENGRRIPIGPQPT